MWYTVGYCFNVKILFFSLVKLFTNFIEETPDYISLLITRYNIPNSNFVGHNTH